MTLCALVIGCTGQDGSYLTKFLLKKDYKVIGISRKNVPNLINHQKLGIHKQIEIVQDYLNCIDSFSKTLLKFCPDEIYSLSAQSSVGLSFKDPQPTFQSISLATSVILESCRIHGFRGKIFFAGSSEIFGETSEPATVNSEKSPISPYGVYKYQSLLMADMYRKVYGLSTTTGILFNHESPLRSLNFVTQKIIQGAKKTVINPNYKIRLGNLNVFRDWGWAEEYVNAMYKINKSDSRENHIICTGEVHSLEEFAIKVYEKMNLNFFDHVEIDKHLTRTFDIKKNYGDPTKLKEKLGWEATKKFNDIINLLLEE